MVHFSDIFDAINAHDEIKSTHPEWPVEFISPTAFAEVSTLRELMGLSHLFGQKTSANSPCINAHDGQVCLVADYRAVERLNGATVRVSVFRYIAHGN